VQRITIIAALTTPTHSQRSETLKDVPANQPLLLLEHGALPCPHTQHAMRMRGSPFSHTPTFPRTPVTSCGCFAGPRGSATGCASILSTALRAPFVPIKLDHLQHGSVMSHMASCSSHVAQLTGAGRVCIACLRVRESITNSTVQCGPAIGALAAHKQWPLAVCVFPGGQWLGRAPPCRSAPGHTMTSCDSSTARRRPPAAGVRSAERAGGGAHTRAELG
jgi:hypothetical protein